MGEGQPRLRMLGSHPPFGRLPVDSPFQARNTTQPGCYPVVVFVLAVAILLPVPARATPSVLMWGIPISQIRQSSKPVVDDMIRPDAHTDLQVRCLDRERIPALPMDPTPRRGHSASKRLDAHILNEPEVRGVVLRRLRHVLRVQPEEPPIACSSRAPRRAPSAAHP